MTKTNENHKQSLAELRASHNFTSLTATEEKELSGGSKGEEEKEALFKCPSQTYWSEKCGKCISFGSSELDCG